MASEDDEAFVVAPFSAALASMPTLLGIGIDEATAAIVQQDQ